MRLVYLLFLLVVLTLSLTLPIAHGNAGKTGRTITIGGSRTMGVGEVENEVGNSEVNRIIVTRQEGDILIIDVKPIYRLPNGVPVIVTNTSEGLKYI